MGERGKTLPSTSVIENKLDADKLCEQVLINMRSRVKAESTRLNLKKTLTSSNDMTSRVEKFVDCRSKDKNEREIFIVEGDSALGACKQARDSAFQAVIPVRGKILNCLKCDYNRIFKSDIIVDLVKVLGCGVEVTGKHSKELSMFNLDALRWNKVIICTDADVDGFHIRTLILTMIYRLMPTLIREGKVFIAESPLYEITSKGETWFAYTEKEKVDALEQIGNAKYTSICAPLNAKPSSNTSVIKCKNGSCAIYTNTVQETISFTQFFSCQSPALISYWRQTAAKPVSTFTLYNKSKTSSTNGSSPIVAEINA